MKYDIVALSIIVRYIAVKVYLTITQLIAKLVHLAKLSAMPFTTIGVHYSE